MQIVKLVVEKRDSVGSSGARRDRRAGRLPMVIYGMNREPSNLTADRHAFELEFQKGSRMFELALGDKTQVCLLKDIQYDALGDTLLHADLFRVDDSKPVTVAVALEFVGMPGAVSGAVMDYVNRDIQVTSLPRSIPPKLEVSLAGLEVGAHLEAKDVVLPQGVSLGDLPDKTIVSYHYKHAPTVEVTEEEPEGGAEPEVLTERRPTEDE